jgi:hypothetical protein
MSAGLPFCALFGAGINGDELSNSFLNIVEGAFG